MTINNVNENPAENDNPTEETEVSDKADLQEDLSEALDADGGQELGQDETPEEELDPLSLALLEISKLQQEREALKDQALRAVAEAENTRRRMEQERQRLTKYGVEPLAKDLLTAIDNLQRALDSVSEEEAAKDPLLNNLRVGVEMTAKDLAKALTKNKVEILDPTGESFDPNLHQAMFEAPNPDVEPGKVIQVIAKGYVLHDRLLRAAMVGVSKQA